MLDVLEVAELLDDDAQVVEPRSRALSLIHDEAVKTVL